MTCPDLQRLFGDRFKLGHDPAYFADYGDGAHRHNPWLLMVECMNGHIYPHDVDTLAASTNNNGSIATALAALDCTTVVQAGNDGTNATFHLKDFDKVAALMRPRIRHRGRPMTDEQKKRFADQGRAVLASRRAATHGPKSPLESPPTTPDVVSPTSTHPIA